MPPPGGVRTPIAPDRMTAAAQGRVDPRSFAVSAGDMTRYEAVFQSQAGIFSPGYPLAPTQPEPVRGFDFPTSINTGLATRAYEPISFEQLRALADHHDITRLAIETRKDQIEKLEWSIRPREDKSPAGDAEERIDQATDFFNSPDRVQPFAEWVRGAMEDLMVLDAPAFEVRRNRGGKLIGLDPVDGSTIKVLVDNYGRRPMPPAPAYMQVIHGRPWRLLTNDELLYRPRNRRAHKLYGFSPVEQIIMTVNIGLRRQIAQLLHFTDGNIPRGMASAPDGWTSEQIATYQEWFNSQLAGNMAERSRVIWGPFGAKYEAFKDSPIKDEFDEWLARIVCYAFSLPPTAFTKQMNRATAESAQQTALEEGLQPLMNWIKRLADYVLNTLFGWPDLEFAWNDIRPVDPEIQAKVLEIYTRAGINTHDEARDQIGLDPYPNGLGKTPLIIAGATVIRLEDALVPPPDPIELAQAQAEAKAAAQPPGAPGVPGAPGADDKGGAQPNPKPGANGQPKPGAAGAKPAANAAGGKGAAVAAPAKDAKPGERTANGKKAKDGAGKKLKKHAGDATPMPGDLITVESDTGAASNAPWTSRVTDADGWRVCVEYDDGAAWYEFDPANCDGIEDEGTGEGAPTHWFFAKAARVPTAAEVDAAAAETHPEPSDAQIQAGNYRKGHVRVHGLDVSIENPKGSTRRGVGPTGEPWEAELPSHYGYIRRTVGADDEHIDVFIGPNPESETAYVVDQVDADTGAWDEHKILIGYDSLDAALADYRSAFSDGKDRIGAVSRISIAGLKEWLKTGDLTAPIGARVGKAYGFAARGSIERTRARVAGQHQHY